MDRIDLRNIQLTTKPKFGSEKFQCPHCQAISQQQWFNEKTASGTINKLIGHIYYDYRTQIQDYQQNAIVDFISTINNTFAQGMRGFIPSKFSVATCMLCKEISLWVGELIVYPKTTSIAPANEDLDDDIKSLYQEATFIFQDSPKGSTALLRLALQKLLKQVGKSGNNINSDIKELVAEGLSPKIQQALDLLRVVGNHAVHPGQINLDDNSEIAFKLFQILNFIADELITKPKELESLYNNIVPEQTQEHIKQRDAN
jgi:Domain of unknown function (DUF4145)